MIKTNIFGEEFASRAKAALLSNEEGDYLLYSDDYTKYQGICFNKGMEIYKTIDKIILKNSKVLDLIFGENSIEVLTDKGNQKFFLYNEGVIYENLSDSESDFILDFRKLFDMSNFGRFYEVSNSNGIILIKFDKKKDISEQNNEEYQMYLAIKTLDSDVKENKVWSSVNYEFDSKRNDVSERYTYNAFSSKSKRFAISFSIDKQEAIDKAIILYSKENVEKKQNITKLNASKEINYAYNLSLNAIKNLYKKKLSGIYAGFPWFMQFWTRDSALSSKAISLIDEEFVRNLLYNYVKSIREDGLISNRYPYSNLDSIDSTGIVFFRIKENLDIFNKDEIKFIYENLKKSIDAIYLNYFDKFVMCKKYETWMDTDVRDGARIEIQALFLSMLSFARELSIKFSDPTSTKIYLKKEKELLDLTKKSFFVDQKLYDGVNDPTIRPNVFLAYYFYPKLLLDKEWEKVFSKTLEATFLDWGGVSTIDKKDSRFTDRHTGMNNFSYHNGDSWYYINNLAALCLFRINKNKYKKYIDKIVSASSEEILSLGIFGYHSEISSANSLEPNGCLAQAWSSAFYIEMIKEIFH